MQIALDSIDFPAYQVRRRYDQAAIARMAQSLLIKPNKPLGELRREIAGKAPAWRPPGATFGAAGPKPTEKPATVREDAA